MPYKSEHIRLSEKQDRRRKLTEEQKEDIRTLYAQGRASQRVLGELYGVSKSCIAIVVNPTRAEQVKQRVKDHWKDYADKDAHNKAVTNLRHYKHDLYEKGELKEK